MGKRRPAGPRRTNSTKKTATTPTHQRKSQSVSHNKVTKSTSKAAPRQPLKSARATPPTIPFSAPHDRILLVGEGDFSHALSLLSQRHYTGHGERITATAYDGEAAVFEKYPQARATVEALRRSGVRLLFGVDAGKLGRELLKSAGRGEKVEHDDGGEVSSSDGEVGESEEAGHVEVDEENGFQGFSTDESDAPNATTRQPLPVQQRASRRKRGKAIFFDRIIFNFPHVGGKSTDVNRQVRANQELLVRFFKAASPLLQPPEIDNARERAKTNNTGESDDGGGKIIVTLFEGQPYSLWNIRDLARHSRLKVVKSFRFPWEAYPGYQHARTIGNIRAKNASVAEDWGMEGRRGWKGEEREARSFLFEVAGTNPVSEIGGRIQRKWSRGDEESSSTDDD